MKILENKFEGPNSQFLFKSELERKSPIPRESKSKIKNLEET